MAAHPKSVAPLEEGDEILTYARIDAQNIHIPMPRCKVDLTIDEGDVLKIGDKTLEVWSTPGHTAGQLSFRLGELLFSGDNIFKDGCVGVIDAHHGSNLVDFIASLKRIRGCDAKYLLPSHGPIFRKDDVLIEATIARLEQYTHMADFGTCADRLAVAGRLGRRPGERHSARVKYFSRPKMLRLSLPSTNPDARGSRRPRRNAASRAGIDDRAIPRRAGSLQRRAPEASRIPCDTPLENPR